MAPTTTPRNGGSFSSPSGTPPSSPPSSSKKKATIKRQMAKAYSVQYDSSDHFAVVTQLYGSMWPRVLPYCIFNVVSMAVLTYLHTHYTELEKIKITTQGHTFIAVVVAFLLVSRVNTALVRFNESRAFLSLMYRETRELISTMAITTGDDAREEAKQWRQEVAYRTLLLLRTSMAVVDYPTDCLPPWQVPELSGEELEDIQKNTYLNPEVRDLCHDPERSEFEESMRVPIRISYLLRKSIHSHHAHLETPLSVPMENKLLGSVDTFMNGYYGIRKFLTTPVPFPLVQMARTFLFSCVFTVPFALLSDSSTTVAHCIEVFILTYGFMGLELVAIEMDDPFGDDENDFDNLAVAYVSMEDTYLTIMDVDGYEWASKLRQRMHDPLLNEAWQATERTHLLMA